MAILEVWRPVPGAPYFIVSNRGRVWHLLTDEQMEPHLDDDFDEDPFIGVNLLNVNGEECCMPVDALVVEAFVGPVDGLETIVHLDGDPYNCEVWNLSVNDAYWNHGCKADDCE